MSKTTGMGNELTRMAYSNFFIACAMSVYIFDLLLDCLVTVLHAVWSSRRAIILVDSHVVLQLAKDG
jgi:hypothetical protein